MIYGGGAAAAGAAAAAIAQAIKASGAVVKLTPEDFQQILNRCHEPLVVVASGGLFSKKHDYLTAYKGFFFYTRTTDPLQLPAMAEVVAAKTIWVPG